MNISIRSRIHLGFFLFAFLFLVNGAITIYTLYQGRRQASYVATVLDPSIERLEEVHDMMTETRIYATNWVFLRSSYADKEALKIIHDNSFPQLRKKMLALAAQWRSRADADTLQAFFKGLDGLLQIQKGVMKTLQTFESYDDPVIKLGAEKIIEDEVIPRTAALTVLLRSIIKEVRQTRTREQEIFEATAGRLRSFIVALSVLVVISSFLLATYFTRVILKPISRLQDIVNDLGRGVTRKIQHRGKSSELDRMIVSVNQLSEKLQYTAEFAEQTGRRNFSMSFQPLSDEDTLGKALLTMRDNLESVDKSLNEAQHIARLGNWERDLATNRIFWSDELYSIFGLDKNEFVPTREGFLQFVHPEDRDMILQHSAGCLQDHQPFSYEFRLVDAKGRKKTFCAQGKCKLNDHGEPEKLYGIVQDITELKNAEATLKLKNSELEVKNKELEQFAYVASHDLQEPLRTISSFVDRFQQQYTGRIDKAADKYLHYIVHASDRMKVLIKDLLDYSRIGRQTELVRIDCNGLLNEVLADLGTAIEETQATVVADPLPVINGYPTEMKLLFQNLIFNAIKFRKQEVAPRIKVLAQKDAKGWRFGVQDNGIGIEPEHNERIFVIFQRLHTRTEYEGSGIGLSHCKKIVELHGGKIWVKSKPGEGSTFYFTLLDNLN